MLVNIINQCLDVKEKIKIKHELPSTRESMKSYSCTIFNGFLFIRQNYNLDRILCQDQRLQP